MEQAEKDFDTTAILIVAAGSSSRLGRPKQLVAYNGLSLLQHSVKVALGAGLGPVAVVLGAHADEVQRAIKEQPVQVAFNTDWQEGMAASIRAGVAHLMQAHPLVAGIILMVCDQPFVSSTLLQQLHAAHLQTGKPVITCSYANTFGPPTFFHRSMFSLLLQLKGDVGARSILKAHAISVEAIPFPQGVVDIDTDADVQKINEKPAS